MTLTENEKSMMTGGTCNIKYADDMTTSGAEINPSSILSDLEELAEPKFRKAIIDLSINMPEPVPVLKKGNAVIFTIGNVSTITGLAKSRKTFLSVLFAAEYLKSESGKVLVTDTEMHVSHTYRTARRIHKLMGWETGRNNGRLTVLTLREYSPDERLKIFVEAIECLKPQLVFLDGVADLMQDFNNNEESTRIIGLLMKLSSMHDCHICVALHLNKGNGQLKGHIGSRILEKSETILSVIKDGDISTVNPEYTRDLTFESFSFRIDEDGLPEYCDAPARPAKVDNMREMFESIFSNCMSLSYSDLRNRVMIAGSIKTAAAQNRISDAVFHGIIIKSQGGYYLSKHNRDENTLPF